MQLLSWVSGTKFHTFACHPSDLPRLGLTIRRTDLQLVHQSIPAVPIPPPPGQPRGICSSCQSRGCGIRNFIAARGLGISLPRGDPRAFDTRVFELTWKSLSEKTRPSLKTGLSVTDSKNLWMFLKICFLKFRYFFIYTCKHMNI